MVHFLQKKKILLTEFYHKTEENQQLDFGFRISDFGFLPCVLFSLTVAQRFRV